MPGRISAGPWPALLALLLCCRSIASPGVDLPSGRAHTDAPPDLPQAELIGFFWYGCPHCYRMESLLREAGLQRRVHYIPAVIRGSWLHAAKLFYALQAMGELERLHATLFEDVHERGLGIGNRADIEALVTRHQVDRGRFLRYYDSGEVREKARDAVLLTRRYAAGGVPGFVIRQRHIVNPETSGGLPGTLEAIQRLLQATDAAESTSLNGR